MHFEITGKINVLKFDHVSKAQARRIINLRGKIYLDVGGKIGGLLLKDGRIALHHAGNFLKKCPWQDQTEDSEIFLTIVNYETGELLAKYAAIYSQN